MIMAVVAMLIVVVSRVMVIMMPLLLLVLIIIPLATVGSVRLLGRIRYGVSLLSRICGGRSSVVLVVVSVGEVMVLRVIWKWP